MGVGELDDTFEVEGSGVCGDKKAVDVDKGKRMVPLEFVTAT